MAKRRANGEGNIRKRKDGRWEGRYTAGYDPETGKRITKNVLGKTQAEVKEKLKVAITEGQRLDISKAGNYTVAAWVRTWYEVYAEPRIRPNTREYYMNYIENHVVPGIGKIMLDKLTTIQIQRFYNNLQKNGRVQRKGYPELKDKSLSPRVVRGVHTLLSNCLDQAVAERLILVNPAQGCKLPKLEKKEMRILPQEKISMYLAEAERRGLLAAFYLELTTGLRRGELLALLWTDLDTEARTISRGNWWSVRQRRRTLYVRWRFPSRRWTSWLRNTRSIQAIRICSHHQRQERCTTLMTSDGLTIKS